MSDRHELTRLVDTASARLDAAGIPDGKRESARLLASVTGRAVLEILVGHGDAPSVADRTRFEALVQRRAERVPLQILTGIVDFHEIQLETEAGVFVPRSETEMLVEAVSRHLEERAGAETSLLDVGTGSGTIPVALLARFEHLQATATDLSRKALDLARRNAERASVATRLRCLLADLLNGLRGHRDFDVLVSNPPYIRSAEIEALEPEVRDHDPRLALDGGPDGLAAYRRISARARDLLRPGGFVALEIGADQGPAVVELLTEAGLTLAEVHEDLAGLARVVTARAP